MFGIIQNTRSKVKHPAPIRLPGAARRRATIGAWTPGAPESLSLILVGALVVLPVILAYTVLAWRVFGGKAQDLTYY